MKTSLLVLGVFGCAPPQENLITASFVDPENVSRISMFRSCCGHDYSVPSEPESSMKHYIHQVDSFGVSNDEFEIFAPFDGKIGRVVADSRELPCYNDTHGFQMYLHPDAQPSVAIKLFHVNPVIESGDIAAGDLIAYGDFRECAYDDSSQISENPSSFDISLQRGDHPYPVFEAMTDDVFGGWNDAGVGSPAGTVISAEDREAQACTDYWQECADGMIGLWGNQAYPPYW